MPARNPPATVLSSRTRLTGYPIARAASALSPTAPSPGPSVRMGDAVAAHAPHPGGALKAEIDAPAFLGRALAEADEQEWRAGPDAAAQPRQRNAPPPKRLHLTRSAGGRCETAR